jgi:hypothetical protein
MLAAAGRPAVVPAGAEARRHRRRDDRGEVKYDGGGIDTADYDGHAYDYGGGHAGDAHKYDHQARRATFMATAIERRSQK